MSNSLQRMNCSQLGSSIHGILQARILEWFAMIFSRGSSQPRNWTWVSCIVGRFFTIWATREVDLHTLLCLPGSSDSKNPPAMKETQVWSLGQEDPLEKEMATHSSILAWRIPWTEESWGHKESRHDWVTNTHTYTCIPLFLFAQNVWQ